ncbi:2297_t:CDS:2 [Paraglomus occultum]|uniref:2297_t:CDS:1 n=1 Tax=Paraglomus occultum TaxID=144539 RepID=A0A9N9BAJ5_9GLOM|nr:2297_t:CDS:2 [Paraglomus occultum]
MYDNADSTEVEDLFACFDSFNALTDFETQLQALYDNDANMNIDSQYSNLSEWGDVPIFNTSPFSVSSPEANSISTVGSPNSYCEDNISLPNLSPSLTTLNDTFPEFQYSTLEEPYDQQSHELGGPVVENVKKRQNVEDDSFPADDNDDDENTKKKRKATMNTKYRKSNISPKMAKKQYYKSECNENNATMSFVDGVQVPLCVDGTALPNVQSIVVPNSPVSGIPPNYNANALLGLGQGIWSSDISPGVSPQPTGFVPIFNNDVSSGVPDMPSQFNVSLLGGKVPIQRIKSSTSQPLTNTTAQPTKQQKKIAHNAIERRYRNNINDRINELKNVVPALNHHKHKDTKEIDDEEEAEEIDGIPAATKLNKATILRKATEYIIHLRKINQRFKEENENLKRILEAFPGAIDLYQEYIDNRNDPSTPEDISPPASDPPTPSTSSSAGAGTRMLMAIFMCMTFFSPPSDYGQPAHGDHASMVHHHHEARVSSAHPNGMANIAKANSAGFFSGDGIITIDIWYLIRSITFIMLMIYILRPSFLNKSRRVQKPKQHIASVLAAKNKDVRTQYVSVTELTSYAPSNSMEILFGITVESFKFFIRRVLGWDITASQDNEEKLWEVALWNRQGELELSGGNNKASRFSVLYVCLRTINLFETTCITRKCIIASPSRIYINAALQSYIGLQSMPFIAQKVAAHFWGRAIKEKGRDGHEDKWTEIALTIKQGSNLWKDAMNRVFEQAFNPQNVTDDITRSATIPLTRFSDAQSLAHLKDAYLKFISQNYGKKKLRKSKDLFADILAVTTHTSSTHWYAFVGSTIVTFLNGGKQIDDKLINQLREKFPKSENTNTQVLARGLLSHAFLMYGKIEASVRCAEKAAIALKRRNEDSSDDMVVEEETEISALEKEVHDLAEFCVGWIVLEARVLGWKAIENLSKENKSLKLPDVLDPEISLKPAVYEWLLYMRRLVSTNTFRNVAEEIREESLKKLHALTRLIGEVDEEDDSGYEGEPEKENENNKNLDNKAVRAWYILKST